MKKVILSILALFVTGTVLFASTGNPKSCCTKGSACCAVNAPCCQAK